MRGAPELATAPPPPPDEPTLPNALEIKAKAPPIRIGIAAKPIGPNPLAAAVATTTAFS